MSKNNKSITLKSSGDMADFNSPGLKRKEKSINLRHTNVFWVSIHWKPSYNKWTIGTYLSRCFSSCLPLVSLIPRVLPRSRSSLSISGLCKFTLYLKRYLNVTVSAIYKSLKCPFIDVFDGQICSSESV